MKRPLSLYVTYLLLVFVLSSMFWENAKLQSVSCMEIYIVGPTGIPNIYRTITLANIFILVIQLFDFMRIRFILIKVLQMQLNTTSRQQVANKTFSIL